MNEGNGNRTVLVTGGCGFFGELLKKRLLDYGMFCVSIDLERDEHHHQNLVSVRGDVRNKTVLDEIFSQYGFDAIFHCAAILAHAVKDKDLLWACNVGGTQNIAEYAKSYGVPKIIFTSSNCLWGKGFRRPVSEDDTPEPVEAYGKSKWEAEKALLAYSDYLDVVILRCPTIIDCGRLGLLAILFEFIDEGRRVWLIGDGSNRYQFIYAQDLIDACIYSLAYGASDVFNVGSDNVSSLKEVYGYVVDKAGMGSKVSFLPKRPALLAMKTACLLNISPLGPYHYNMIAADFLFDTSKIKQKLGWRPTLTNQEMLYKAYEYYRENAGDIRKRQGVSAHKRKTEMGIIRLLKWVS